MKKGIFVLLLLLGGCVSFPKVENTYISPIKPAKLDESSQTTGYIAVSSQYRQITYDNLGGIEQNFNSTSFSAFLPEQMLFRPLSPSGKNTSTLVYNLDMKRKIPNKLYLFPVAAGMYQRAKPGNYNGRFTGATFEIKPGEVMYFGHVHMQRDLERNILLGDHYEEICYGIANRYGDAVKTIRKYNRHINIDNSLTAGFRMKYPESGRTHCQILAQN